MIKMLKITSLILLFILPSCKNSDIASPPEETPRCSYTEGKRPVSFRNDTVGVPGSIVGGVWAFSDSNAFVIGRLFRYENGVLNGYTALRWNGKEWTNDTYSKPLEIGHTSHDLTGDDNYLVSVGYWNDGKPAIGEFNNKTKKWKKSQFETQGELLSVWTDGKGYFFACGQNGTVYTKDGYNAVWNYTKAPTDFNLRKIAGINKNDIYLRGYSQDISTGKTYAQVWHILNGEWIKLVDQRDTAGTFIKIPDEITDIAVTYCPATDSVSLYVIGWESYIFKSKYNENKFRTTYMSSLGLPLKAMQLSALTIHFFSPDDYWVMGSKFNFFHWNGKTFQQVIIPGLPINEFYGYQYKLVKTASGKLFIPTEAAYDGYFVIQAKP